MRSLRAAPYLLAFSVPVLTAWGIACGGLYTFAGPAYLFGLVPLLDLLSGRDQRLLPSGRADGPLLPTHLEHGILGIFVTLHLLLVVWAATLLASGSATALEWIGLTTAVGSHGGVALNAAHQLSHAPERPLRAYAMLIYAFSARLDFPAEHQLGPTATRRRSAASAPTWSSSAHLGSSLSAWPSD